MPQTPQNRSVWQPGQSTDLFLALEDPDAMYNFSAEIAHAKRIRAMRDELAEIQTRFNRLQRPADDLAALVRACERYAEGAPA